MSEEQILAVKWWLRTLKIIIINKRVHHGDCVGSDEQFHNFAIILNYRIIVHPPTAERFRAFCKGGEVRTPKQYYDRDQDIVDETSLLIATPKTKKEFGGTWHTINYARSLNKPIIIIYPDGTETRE